MKFRPLHDRILVERVESEEVTKGGIILPDTAKEKPQQGKIIAVGSGKRTEDGKIIPLELKAGDTILKLGEYPIANLDDFDTALRKFKAGDRVAVLLKRGNDEMNFEVTLEPPRQ